MAGRYTLCEAAIENRVGDRRKKKKRKKKYIYIKSASGSDARCAFLTRIKRVGIDDRTSSNSMSTSRTFLYPRILIGIPRERYTKSIDHFDGRATLKKENNKTRSHLRDELERGSSPKGLITKGYDKVTLGRWKG